MSEVAKITFIDAIRIALTKYFDFKSSATRAEFWYFFLFTLLVGIVLSTLDGLIWPMDTESDPLALATTPAPFSSLANLALLIPSLAITARRFRDAGWSPHWLWLYFAPVLTLIFGVINLIGYLVERGPGAVQSFDGVIAILLMFVPTIIVAISVSLFFLILALLPSKSKADGNRHLKSEDSTSGNGETQSAAPNTEGVNDDYSPKY